MNQRTMVAPAVLLVVGALGCPDREPASAPASGAAAAAAAANPASAGDACPTEWLRAPAVDPAIAVPGGAASAAVRVAAAGTQNYACTRTSGDGGPGYAWTLTGPEATLRDCHGAVVGSHVPSEAGASAPEWKLQSGAHVVAHKVAASPAPAAGAVAWLLLGVDSRGGDGPLAQARFIQRVATRGGAAPTAGCDATTVGAVQKVAYEAEYYFFP